ncbi:MAG: prepilin-type N-terminal cleavage/methylation domain-containing protein [Candidatus Paceibacterota bacterium]
MQVQIKMINKNKKILGFTLVEVLVACSIISLSMFALMQTAENGIRLSNEALTKSQASLLLEEGAESVKLIRDSSWTTIANLNLNTPYHLFFNTTTKVWELNASTTNLSGCIPSYPIDGVFNRTVTFSSVGRDANDEILASGGTIDTGTKKVIIVVTWNSQKVLISKSLSFYISNIFN